MKTEGKKRGRALKEAFPHTIPVLAGYIFLGITYGILMRTSGFPWWLPVLTALIIYTGSLEFLMTNILLSSFNPLSVLVTAVMVGARHLFYGISLLNTYKNMGWKKFYLIYTTSDETFSVVYTTPAPEGVDRGWFYFWISLLDQIYWVSGACIGGIVGGFLTFNIEGLDFVMTAMFVVIFMNQWVKDGTSLRTVVRDHLPALIGIGGSILCLVLFGPDQFIIPSMIVILACLAGTRNFLERKDPGQAGSEDMEKRTSAEMTTEETSEETSKEIPEGASDRVSKTVSEQSTDGNTEGGCR